MYEISENTSQESNLMDLTVSPTTKNNFSPKILDRPPRNFGKVGNLRSVHELPEKYRCVFEFPFFNIIQSNVLDDVLYSDASVVISAPTGSGKTVVFELAIIKLLMNFEETNFIGPFNIIYVAPLKSLCHERLSEWHIKFSKIGISCIVCTGDNENMDIRCLKNYNIIITTPEKWDSITRNSKEHDILHNVKLFLIDEVHLLNEESRGPNLEVTVSRMKILKTQENMRFLAVSATIPNIEDIAQWLGGDEPAVYFKIGEELRPVKLNKIVLGYPYPEGSSPFKFELNLNYRLQNILMQYSEGKPTLIFCSTRKSVETTAVFLSKNLSIHLQPIQQLALEEAAKCVRGTALAGALQRGVGAHHAGLSPEERRATEQVFREGHLPLLLSTATLAAGVNLPAHTVVLKGTMQYCGGGFQEYPESTILQMLGRAGRPQFDTKANVVIMTTLQQKKKYEKMLGGTELIESNLHRHLTEHLNAEIALGTITDIAIALNWLRYTFLYIRVLKNPKHYNIPINFTKTQIEKRLQDWCQIEINALHKHGMLQIDQIDGFSVTPTNSGILMTNYYLAFNTMKIFSEISGTETLSELLVLVSKCPEFSEAYLRVNDKKTLNLLNNNKYQETIRFPMKGVIKTTPMKIYCLIQAIFGCIRIQNPTLYQESIKIMKIGERIAKCLVTFLLHKQKLFSALLNALILNQCFNAQLWENSQYVAKQLPKIGPVLSNMLASAGKTNFKSILESSPRDIERIINRSPPMGNEILEAVLHLPFYKLTLECSEIDKYTLKIIVTLLNAEDISKDKECTSSLNSYMTLIVGDSDNNILCCKKIYHLSMASNKNNVEYINLLIRTDHNIKAYLISENWVGIDCKENYDIIVKNEQISPKNINFPSNNTNKKTLTTSFSPAKKNTEVKTTRKQTNTIDKFFQSTKNIPKPVTPFDNDINNVQNTGINPATKDIVYTEENTYLNNFVNFEQNRTQNSELNSKNIGNTKFKNTFFEEFDKHIAKSQDKWPKVKLLEPKSNYMIPQDFRTFSQNLAEKFSQDNTRQNYENSGTNVVKKIENNIKLKSMLKQFEFKTTNSKNKINKPIFKNIPEGPKFANQFKSIKYQNVFKNSVFKNKPTESNFENSPVCFSQNYSQTESSQSQKNNITNIELEKFKKFMQNKNKGNEKTATNSFQNNSEIYPIEYCTVEYNNRFDNSPHRFENIPRSFDNSPQNFENIGDNSFQNKIEENKAIEVINISEDNEENNETSNFENEKLVVEKPKFFSSFREYVQNSIDTLKKKTLVNEYFNYDIGFQEFLMGPLDNSGSSSSDISVTENNINNTETFSQNFEAQNQNFTCQAPEIEKFQVLNERTPENSFTSREIQCSEMNNKTFSQNRNFTFQASEIEKFPGLNERTPENSFTSPEMQCSDMNNITFSCSGKILTENKSVENFEHDFNKYELNYSPGVLQPENLEYKSPENTQITFPEISDGNFSFSCSGNIFKNTQQNLQNSLSYSPEIDHENIQKGPENSENSESSEEYSKKVMVKVENRLKIIEQYYNTQESLENIPVKRQKLSNSYSIQNTFNKPIDEKHDVFKNMTALNNIMKKYGQFKNKISLDQNKDKEINTEPLRNELVKKKTYSYTLTICEKDKEASYSKAERKKKNY